MNTSFMLKCIFWYTTLITIPYMVFGGSCEFRASRNGPWATQECYESSGLDPEATISYRYSCEQDSSSGISSMKIMEYDNSFTCDGAVTFESTFTNGVHCDDNSNSCNIIEMTESFWYNENNCQGDPDEYDTRYLTDAALNRFDECYTTSSHAYKYTYEEENGLIAYEWEASSGCHGEPSSTISYLTGCEETGTSSSRSYTFITREPLSEEVECCDSSNYMTDIGVDVNAVSHEEKQNIYSADECCSLCNDHEFCLSFSYVRGESVCYLYQITIDESITISSPGTISSNKCFEQEEEEEEEEKGCCDSSNYLYNTCHASHAGGSRYTLDHIDSIDECCSLCDEREGCLSFSYLQDDEFGCYLFETVIDNDRIDRDGCVSANKECDEEEEEEEEVECCDSSNYLSDTSHIGTPLDLAIDVGIESAYDCCSLCDETEGCLSFTYHSSNEFVGCYLYDTAIDDGVTMRTVGDISGNIECDEDEEEEEELECCDSSNYLSDTAHSAFAPPLYIYRNSVVSLYDCCSVCDETEGCLSFTYHLSEEEESVYCYLYGSVISDGVARTIVGDISGNIECGI